jgi:serine protease Do
MLQIKAGAESVCMMRWIAALFVLLAGLASANPSDEFVKLKASIDTRHLEDALKNLKSEETNKTLSDVEFLLLTSYFMTASGQPFKALKLAEKAEYSTTGYESEIAEARARAYLQQGDLERADQYATNALEKNGDNVVARLIQLQIESDLNNALLTQKFERLLKRTNGNQVVWIAYLDQALRSAEPDTTLPNRAFIELGDTGLMTEYRAKFHFKANKRYEAYQLFTKAAEIYVKEGNTIAQNRVNRWLEIHGKYANKSEPVELAPTANPQTTGSKRDDQLSINQVVVLIAPPDGTTPPVEKEPRPLPPLSPEEPKRELIQPADTNQSQDIEPIKVVTKGDIGTGSGFITNQGHWVVTNRHVVENADRIIVRNGTGKIRHVAKYFLDEQDDIALLYLDEPYPADYSVEMTDIIDPTGGDELFVMGFPLTSVLGSHHPSITEGIVSKEAGFADMPNHFLLTANLNEGNSGGPIFSRDGRVLGIAVAKLDKTKVLETTGMLPEDVNVGIKGREVRRFLRTNVPPSSDARPALSPREAYSALRSQVVLVVSIDD